MDCKEERELHGGQTVGSRAFEEGDPFHFSVYNDSAELLRNALKRTSAWFWGFPECSSSSQLKLLKVYVSSGLKPRPQHYKHFLLVFWLHFLSPWVQLLIWSLARNYVSFRPFVYPNSIFSFCRFITIWAHLESGTFWVSN